MGIAFLHGGGQGSWVWQDTIAALRDQFCDEPLAISALDVPGCGVKRGRDTEGVTLPDVAAELVRDLDAAGFRECVLVGHSQAGQAMAIMAAIAPEMFSRLIFVTCSIPIPGQTVTHMMGNGVRGANRNQIGWPLDPNMVSREAQYAHMFCNDMTEDARLTFLSQLGHDRWPLSTYCHNDWTYDHLAAVPSTFVKCQRDDILPLDWQDVFAQRFQTDRTVAIDAGHQVMNTQPHTLAQIIGQEAGLGVGDINTIETEEVCPPTTGANMNKLM